MTELIRLEIERQRKREYDCQLVEWLPNIFCSKDRNLGIY